MLARSSEEPEVGRKVSPGTSGSPSADSPSHPPANPAPPTDAAHDAPEGGSGEWLQQYAWALEDGNLEQASSLLRWILAHAEPWAAAQATDLAIERLAQVPEGKGAAASLVRLYHGLGALFPEAHAFHGAFLEKLEAQVRVLAPGTQALTASQAIERALELFKSNLASHASYGTLRAALTEVQLRSHRVVQREKERELEGLLAAGEHERALTLCRELVEVYQSPLASGLMPALLVQSREQADRVTSQLGRRAKEWDWPEAQAANDAPLGLRVNARTGRPINDLPDAPPDPETPRVPWAKAFDAPPVVSIDQESPSDLPSAMQDALKRGVTGHDPAEAGVDGLPDLNSLPAYDVESDTLNRSATRTPRGLEEAVETAQTVQPSGRRVWLWVAIVGLLLAAALAWIVSQRTPSDSTTVSERDPVKGSSPATGQSGEPAPIVVSTPTTALAPPEVASGPPAALTLEITPNDRLELYLDGQLQPAGLVDKLTVPSGHHTIEVYREEYEKYQQDAWATAGGETRIQIQLQRSPTLNLDVNPPDEVSIKMDGRLLSVSPPLANYVISPGQHKLEVSRSGYQTHTEEFAATTGATLKFDLDLKPLSP